MKFIIYFYYKRLFLINNLFKFVYLRYLYRFYIILRFFYCDNFNNNEPRSIVIYDNILIHHYFKLVRLCHDIKVLLKYLFLYSFNINSIKISFSILKT